MFQALARSLFGAPRRDTLRDRLSATTWPAAVYAVGDVHGCLAELILLEDRIFEDGRSIEGEKWIVMLGDYVDRGPDSAGVIEHLLAPPPPGYRRICLAGNHEVMMLAYFANPEPGSDWLRFGGDNTLKSYSIDPYQWSHGPLSQRHRRDILSSHVPDQHLNFLAGLPVCLRLDRTIFVHAGLRPGVSFEDQTEDDLLWIRPGEDDQLDRAFLVVHGHTPYASAFISPRRIGIDTGAFATGILTAVRLTPDGVPFLLDTSP